MICCGIAVGANHVDVVIVDGARGPDTLTLVISRRLELQQGDRALAFRALGDQLSNILHEAKAATVFIKRSAAGPHVKLGHLEAAELRGMVFFVATGSARVTAINPTALARTFGNRKPQEYIKNDDYWKDRNLAELEKRYRDPCLLIIAGLQP
jgi:hypothetical protein